MLKLAYRKGALIALQEAGLIKEGDEGKSIAWPMLLGPFGAGHAAPVGKGWEAAGKTVAGGLVGQLAGGSGGAALGKLIALLSKGKINPATSIPLAGSIGGAAGLLGGAGLGYRQAVPAE